MTGMVEFLGSVDLPGLALGIIFIFAGLILYAAMCTVPVDDGIRKVNNYESEEEGNVEGLESKLYELTQGQVYELVDRLPSETKGQRKEAKHISGEVSRMQPEDKVFVKVDVLEGVAYASILKESHVKGHMERKPIQNGLPSAVIGKFLAIKRIPPVDITA